MLKGIDSTGWTDARHILGLEIEERVITWLTRKGWFIEAHRFHLGHNDIDIIARRGTLVAFIEVKARRNADFGAPEEAVGKKKRRIIERLAWVWITRYGREGDSYRLDIVAIQGPKGKEKVRHIEDAWRPGWR